MIRKNHFMQILIAFPLTLLFVYLFFGLLITMVNPFGPNLSIKRLEEPLATIMLRSFFLWPFI